VALLLIKIDPVSAPAVVGSKVTCRTADCPGFSVTGKVAPVMVNPVPVIAAALMVSAVEPDEVSVTDWLVGVLILTSPKVRLFVLRLRLTVCAFSCSVNTFAMPPALAVNVAVEVDVTAATVALNPAVVAPAGTVTVAGTVTDELLLARLTISPPACATALSVTVQGSVPAPVIVPLPQARELSTPAADCPVPLRLITTVPLLVALLTIVIDPVAAPAVTGSNFTCRVIDCPGLMVAGKVAPDIVKPVPVSVPLLMVNGDEPEELSVTACVAAVLRFTSPKLTVVVLTLKAGASASSSTA
jgi:hypothetical protein